MDVKRLPTQADDVGTTSQPREISKVLWPICDKILLQNAAGVSFSRQLVHGVSKRPQSEISCSRSALVFGNAKSKS